MSEIVERVAQAIAFSGLTGPPSNWPTMWAELEEHERRYHLATARAAMEAMRMLTPEMVYAGDQCCDIYKHGRSTWEAMIDAALCDEPS